MSDFVLAQLEPSPQVWNFYSSLEAAEAAAPAVNAREGTAYQPMTYAQYEAGHNAHYLAGPLLEITEEQWDEALNCLPPMRWEHRDGVERFLMVEMLSGSITAQYARLGSRYFVRNVDAADSSTFITGAECWALMEGSST